MESYYWTIGITVHKVTNKEPKLHNPIQNRVKNIYKGNISDVIRMSIVVY